VGKGKKNPATYQLLLCTFAFLSSSWVLTLLTPDIANTWLVSMLCRVFGNELSHRLGVDRGDFLLRYRCVSCEFKAWLQEDPNLLFDI